MDKLRHLDKNKILQFSQFKMLPAEVFNRQLKRGDQLLLGNECQGQFKNVGFRQKEM